LSEEAGIGLTPPSLVEKAFVKPSCSSGAQTNARTPSDARQAKPARASSLSSVIVSIGIDIIEVARVRAVMERTPRFVLRVFTRAERAYCDARGAAAPQHYAARFAAKEAALKALGTGWSGRIAWQDAEVFSQETGAPGLLFHGHARELYKQSGATQAHLSLSHTSEHAIAQVILERTPLI
jgi:holo-[acyl-carrier protein] synthase